MAMVVVLLVLLLSRTPMWATHRHGTKRIVIDRQKVDHGEASQVTWQRREVVVRQDQHLQLWQRAEQAW